MNSQIIPCLVSSRVLVTTHSDNGVRWMRHSDKVDDSSLLILISIPRLSVRIERTTQPSRIIIKVKDVYRTSSGRVQCY